MSAARGGTAAARRGGPVNLVLMSPEFGEVELRLPGEWPLNPQVAGALKAAPGVVSVEEF